MGLHISLPRCTSCNHLLERADVAARCGRPGRTQRRLAMEAVRLDSEANIDLLLLM